MAEECVQNDANFLAGVNEKNVVQERPDDEIFGFVE